MLANKYNMIEKISEGSFGTIFKGLNVRTNEFVAIKMEPKTENIKTIKNEARIYNYLGKLEGFPQLKWYGTSNELTYLVVDLLGYSLKQIIKIYKVLRIKSILQLGVQMISRLQVLHDLSLIHRDIKPDNFLIGLGNNSSKLYLIDFGFCKKYISNEKHIDLGEPNTKIIGTLNFVSLNVHKGHQPSRRDDIESCIYILVYLYFGKLEWQDLMNEIMIYKLKEQLTTLEEVPMFIKVLLCYVRNLAFEESPNYVYILGIFQKLLKINHITNDNNYEWTNK